MAYERENVTVTGVGPQGGPATRNVRVDDAGIHLDGEVAIPRDAIKSVSLRLGARTTVIVEMNRKRARWPSIRRRDPGFVFTDPRDAAALLGALGHSADDVVAETPLEMSLVTAGLSKMPPWKAAMGALGTILVIYGVVATYMAVVGLLVGSHAHRSGGGHDFAPVMTSLAELVVGLLIAWGLRLEPRLTPLLTIGADGLRTQTLYGDEFVPYGEIASAETKGEAIALTRRDGRRVTLPLKDGERTAEIAARIERGLTRQAAVDHEATELLRNVSAGGAEDVAALRLLADEGSADYRAARVPVERLVRIAEDPAADPESRIRAAIAISGDGKALERLRVAVSNTASPRVRIALGAVQTGAESELDDVMELADVRKKVPR